MSALGLQKVIFGRINDVFRYENNSALPLSYWGTRDKRGYLLDSHDTRTACARISDFESTRCSVKDICKLGERNKKAQIITLT